MILEWILIVVIHGTTPIIPTNDTFETKEKCEFQAIGLMDLAKIRGDEETFAFCAAKEVITKKEEL